MRNIEAIETLINTSKYSKPYLSYEEQLLLLKHRGIKIEDERFALRQLETISYYSLINAYTPLFLNNDNEYENGVTFNDFHLCYKYDTRLKNILFKYIILIEQSLKTNLSSIIAKNYGVQEPTEKIIFENKKGKSKKDYNLKGTYLDAKNYDSNKSFRSGHLRTIANFRDYKKNNSIIHYREKHNHVPPWILIRPLNFGQTIKWLSILKPKDKHEVLLSISPISVSDTLKEVAIPMFEIFRQYRNVIAHGQRFYSFTSDLDTAQLSLNFINNMLEYEFMDKSKYKKGEQLMINNLSLEEVYLLAILLNNDNKMTVKYMRYKTQVGIVSLSSIIKKLNQKGYIIKERSLEDERTIILKLNDCKASLILSIIESCYNTLKQGMKNL